MMQDITEEAVEALPDIRVYFGVEEAASRGLAIVDSGRNICVILVTTVPADVIQDFGK